MRRQYDSFRQIPESVRDACAWSVVVEFPPQQRGYDVLCEKWKVEPHGVLHLSGVILSPRPAHEEQAWKVPWNVFSEMWFGGHCAWTVRGISMGGGTSDVEKGRQ